MVPDLLVAFALVLNALIILKHSKTLKENKEAHIALSTKLSVHRDILTCFMSDVLSQEKVNELLESIRTKYRAEVGK